MHNSFRVFWISLYMFRTVSPSIIRSPRMYIQLQVYVIQVCWLLASAASKQSTNLYDIYLKLYVHSWTPDDGRRDCPKHVEWYSVNSKKIVHLVGFTIEISLLESRCKYNLQRWAQMCSASDVFVDMPSSQIFRLNTGICSWHWKAQWNKRQ